MALYPRIQSPCPYKGRLSDIMDGEVCRLCKREVFDLTAMSDGERVGFMQNCSSEVCVSYRVTPAIAAAAFAVALVAPTMAAACDGIETLIVVAGGIKKPSQVTYVHTGEAPADRAIPTLPVNYDDPAAKPAATSSDTHAAATRPAAP
ncbi:MAG TPA: hypothetical protein VHZ78_01775 [Rhizomicrobium sp.]|jgi:predicted Fe-S protein YdhL (DUF1289 family)|nr:hypothetical protein [Rhizomicrobium sp.]